ncbi:MAG: hypothetical protein ABL308_07285 [Oceanicaulis sp.]
MRKIALAAACVLAGAAAAEARPVSYEGGWTVIGETDRESTYGLVHYTPHHEWSVGWRTEWMRESDVLFNGVQATHLVKRWFAPDSQGNLYASAGAGLAEGIDANPMDAEAAGFIGVMADWETRRWFVSYEARLSDMGAGGDAMQAARLGVAPYVGDFGDLHTWLMVEIDQRAERDEPVAVTPLVRFFKGPVLLELGYTPVDDEPFASFIYRF